MLAVPGTEGSDDKALRPGLPALSKEVDGTSVKPREAWSGEFVPRSGHTAEIFQIHIAPAFKSFTEV